MEIYDFCLHLEAKQNRIHLSSQIITYVSFIDTLHEQCSTQIPNKGEHLFLSVHSSIAL